MNKTLRTAIPLLLLVGLALMTPTAAAEPDPDSVESAIRPLPCRFVEVRTSTIHVGTIATIHGQYVCV